MSIPYVHRCDTTNTILQVIASREPLLVILFT